MAIERAIHRDWRIFIAFTVVVCGLSVVPAVPMAQQADNDTLPALQLQRFRPAPGPGDYLNVYGTMPLSHLDWTVGFYADYADEPMRIRTHYAPYSRTVDYQVNNSLIASLGLADVVELGLLIPMTVFQTTEDLQPVLPTGSTRNQDLQQYAASDWRLTSKFQIVDLSENIMGVALIGGVSLPLAMTDAFSSDEGIGAEGILAGEFNVIDMIRVGVNAGYRHRPGQRILRENVIGNEITWGVGAQSPSFFYHRIDWIAEISGSVGVAKKREAVKGITKGEVPVEAKFGLRYKIMEALTLTTGAATGLTEGVGAPSFRAFAGLGGFWVSGGGWQQYWDGKKQWRPGEGCEMARPHANWPLDELGCPVSREELIRQKDQQAQAMLDVPVQRVEVRPPVEFEPQQEETFIEDDTIVNAEPARVEVTDRQIVIREQIFFATDKAEILPHSYSILDEVANALIDNPLITRLLIEGHTDSRGGFDYNLSLSDRRAQSVMRYLIDQGVDANRLFARGYGPTRPIESNEIAEGRAKNRRVEFTILADDEAIVEPEQ